FAEGTLRINRAVQPYGYFNAVIEPGTLTHQGNQWQAHYRVKPGHRVYIAAISLRMEGPGKNDPSLLKILKDCPLKVGNVFESPFYETARDQLLQAAAQAGWLEAVYSTREVLVSPEHHTARIKLVMQTGKRFYFGPIH